MWQKGEILKAASATYTALLRHPEDKMMAKNLQFYLDKISSNATIDDMDPHVKRFLVMFLHNIFSSKCLFFKQKFAESYVDGLRAYTAENYTEVINKMERSLAQYIRDLNECRAFCEGEFNQGWLPDLITSVASKLKSEHILNIKIRIYT